MQTPQAMSIEANSTAGAPLPTRSKVFVSYSRADIEFAIWAGRSLAERGLTPWIDVKELTPGTDWSSAINDALCECDALLLIMSTESLDSEYCAREWRCARVSGKPVVVAVIEAINMPEELAALPAVDMREWAAPPWDELSRVIATGAPSTPRGLERLRVPRPFAIAGCALAVLFVFQLLVVAQWVDDAGEVLVGSRTLPKTLVLAHLAILLVWISWTTRWAWRFLHREKTFMALLAMVAVPFMWMVHAIISPSQLGFAGLAVSLVMYGFVYAAVDVSGWLQVRTDRGTRYARSMLAWRAPASARKPVRSARGALRFTIHAAPSDERIANRVVALMERSGHRQARTGEPEELRLLLVSNATPVDDGPLADGAATHVPTICVVLTAIGLAEEREALNRYQWVDFRDREDRQIEAIARWLRDGPSANAPATTSEVRPLSHTILPVGPMTISMAMTVLASLLMYGALLRLLERSFMYVSPEPLWGQACEMGSALTAALAAATLRGRLVTFHAFGCAYVAAVGLFLAYVASVGSYAAFYGFVLGTAGLLWYGSAGSIRDWLPSKALPWWRSSTLMPQPPWRFVARQVVVPLTAAAAAAVIFASSEILREF